MEIRLANPDDIELIIPTLLELRPHLVNADIKEAFINQTKEGYRIIYIGDQEVAYAIAGFRTLNLFYSGKTLYIDDLVTNSNHRRKGYAGKLLHWLKTYAEENGYDLISLDSGFQRKDAYRLYLNKGFQIESMHFERKINL